MSDHIDSSKTLQISQSKVEVPRKPVVLVQTRWFHRKSYNQLNERIDTILSRHAEGVSEDMQTKVGLVRLSNEPDVMSMLQSKSSFINLMVFASSIMISTGIIGVLMFLLADKRHFSGGDVVFTAFMTILMTIPVWAFMDTFVPNKRHELLRKVWRGWHVELRNTCENLVNSGVLLPPPILSLMPVIKEKNSSITVLKELGEQDTAAMFAFTTSLQSELERARNCKTNLQPIPVLALKGETGELLCRVSSVLEAPVEDYSAPRLV